MRMLGPIGSGVGTSYWRSGPMTSGERRQLLDHPVDLGRCVVVAEPHSDRAARVLEAQALHDLERVVVAVPHVDPAFGQALGRLGRMLVGDPDRERGRALAGAFGLAD